MGQKTTTGESEAACAALCTSLPGEVHYPLYYNTRLASYTSESLSPYRCVRFYCVLRYKVADAHASWSYLMQSSHSVVLLLLHSPPYSDTLHNFPSQANVQKEALLAVRRTVTRLMTRRAGTVLRHSRSILCLTQRQRHRQEPAIRGATSLA